jgi:chromosome segregation ATPase
LRLADRLHINGAIAYTPSIDYQFGSTPSVAGRLGFSFPLGVISKANSKTTNPDIAAVSAELGSLRQEVGNRDKQISLLKEQLEALVNKQTPAASAGAQAERQLISLLRNRIEELERDKKKSEREDQNQNVLIRELQAKLSAQQMMFNKLMEQVKSLVKPPQ